LSHPASESRTWTDDSRLCQIRGGLNITRGPISRRSERTVSDLSGKLIANPACSAQPTASICSPIQARGRKLTNSSRGLMGSSDMRLDPMERRFSWLSIASFGLAVVPEVVQRIAVSMGATLATCSSNQPGCSRSKSSPDRSTSGKGTSSATS
jgi:hypothetical protein